MEPEILKRIETAKKAESSIQKLIRKIQGRFYSAITDIFLGFDVEDGRIKSSPKNTSKVSALFRVFRGITGTLPRRSHWRHWRMERGADPGQPEILCRHWQIKHQSR
jgi:hypothetical protein